jgi:hypothetical protein
MAAKKTWTKPSVQKLSETEVRSLADRHESVREMLKRNGQSS